MADVQDTNTAQADAPAPDKATVKLQKQVDTLTAKLADVTQDRDTLADANQKLQAEVDEKTAELEQAQAIIDDQTSKLAAAEVSQAEGPVILSHEKAQYRVLAPKFSHKGIEVEAKSLRNNPELVRELVEAGSGLLQKVEPKA